MRASSSLLAVGAALALLALATPARADWDPPPQFLRVSAGVGLVSAYERNNDASGKGTGGYAEAEYYWHVSDWVSPRAYAGLLLTFPDDSSACSELGIDCDTSAKIGFSGLKGRLTIPIPYVAPFIELGVGASIGALRTRTLRIDEEAVVAFHIPVTLGLALGPYHEYELQFAYLYHPSVKQFGGGIAIGISFALDGRAERVRSDS